jgi:NitT/TauT family transport system substrate-binding protein
MMPSSGPSTALAVDKLAGNVTGQVNITSTYTNSFALAANKLEGYTK